MSEPHCAICGEGHWYEDHNPGSELRHEFEAELASEPSKEAYALADSTLAAAIPEPHRTFIASAFQAVVEQRDHEFEMSESFRVRAEAAEADAALAWRRVTELQERGTQLVEERRAADARFEGLLERLREYVDDADNRAIPTYRILQLLDAFIFDEVRP